MPKVYHKYIENFFQESEISESIGRPSSAIPRHDHFDEDYDDDDLV